MKTLVFLQARFHSSRLRGKILATILGKTVLELIVERLRRVRGSQGVVLVTGPREHNEKLVKEAERIGIPVFCGSEENLLERFYGASQRFGPEAIVRVTGDCPLISTELIDQGIALLQEKKCDIVSNTRVRTFPDGMDFEVFTTSALQKVWDKEKGQAVFHVVKELLENPAFLKEDILHDPNLSHVRLTLDYQEDLQLLEQIYGVLYKQGEYFGLEEVLNLLAERPELLGLNEKFVKLDYGIRT